MKRWALLFLSGAAVVGCAFSTLTIRNSLLIGLMLALPLLDRRMHRLPLALDRACLIRQFIALAIIALLLLLHPDYLAEFVILVFLIVLPEEWFFRAWFMSTLKKQVNSWWLANLATSGLFVLAHIPSHGIAGLMVFFPSLALGYLYQQHRDLVLVIATHAIFNMIYIFYLESLLPWM